MPNRQNKINTKGTLPALFKGVDEDLISNSSENKWDDLKVSMTIVCSTLDMDPNLYDPKKTLDELKKIHSANGRMLYSQLSAIIYAGDAKQRDAINVNVDTLLDYAFNRKEEIDGEIVKMVVKLYDHCQLALRQIENVNKQVGISIEDVQNDIKKEAKNIEKDYISILGIFSAVVLVFQGGFTFASASLDNMRGIGILRLLLVMDIVAAVLTNMIHILLRFIAEINGKKKIDNNVWILNCAYLIILIALFCLEGSGKKDMFIF